MTGIDVLLVDDQSVLLKLEKYLPGHRVLRLSSVYELTDFLDGTPPRTLPSGPYDPRLVLVDLVLRPEEPNGIDALIEIRKVLPQDQATICILATDTEQHRDFYPVLAAEVWGAPMPLATREANDLERLGRLADLIAQSTFFGADLPKKIEGLRLVHPMRILGKDPGSRPKTLLEWLFDMEWKRDLWKRLAAGAAFSSACSYAKHSSKDASEKLGQVVLAIQYAGGGRILDVGGDVDLRDAVLEKNWAEANKSRSQHIVGFAQKYQKVLTDPRLHELAKRLYG